MKILIIYYSRTGTTRKVAEAMARLLPADIGELHDLENRDGIRGWFMSCWSAARRKEARIAPVSADASGYEHVVIGTPVWVGTMAAAVRTYLKANFGKFGRYSVFTTQGSFKRQRVFDDIKALVGQAPYLELQLTTASVRAGEFDRHLKDFVLEIKRSLDI